MPYLAWLRQAVDTSGEVIFMTDREGIFTFVNPRFESVYGYSSAEVVGRATPRILKASGPAQEMYSQLWERLQEGRSLEASFENRTRDGRLIEVECSVSPIRNEEQQVVGYLAIQRDVTARRQAERALAESQAHLQLISANMLDLVSQIALDGTFEYVSPSYKTMLGFEPSDLLGTNAFALVHPDDIGRLQRIWADSVIGRKFGRAEFQCRCADGNYLWVETIGKLLADPAGPPRAVILSTRDVSERKRGEELQRDYDHRLRLAVDSADMSLFTQDRELRYTWVHNIHFPVEVAVGSTDRELFPPELADDIVEAKRRALETGERVRREITGAIGGRPVSFDLTVEPLRTASGKIEGLTGAALDTSARRRLEDQLRQAQKLEAIGSLAGGIAHDFNNLLTAIVGYAELALDDLPADSKVRHDIEEILHAGQSAEALTRQLLIFSRKSIVQPVLLRLNDVVTRMDKILRRVVGEHIAFDLNLAGDMALVAADAGQIEQVLMNLVVNARDAMPGGGEVRIETGVSEIDQSFARAHGGTATGTFEWLAVRDSGSGMTAEVQAQIFDPFFTTKSPEKGTGLGLATVHGIVRQAGGYIDVQSEPGKGSRFTVYLPRAERAAEVSRPASSLPRHGEETILFVEDNESIRTMATRALERYGYRVFAAESAEDAFTVAADLHPLDLLITDVVMPGLNGRALAEQLQASHPGLRVVFTSGFTEDSELTAGVQSGERPFVQKPYTIDSLARTIRRVLDGG